MISYARAGRVAIETVGDSSRSTAASTRAVDGITFRVAPGELFGLLGPNGAGKTTTIRILATLLRATSGTARVAGYDVVEPTAGGAAAAGLGHADAHAGRVLHGARDPRVGRSPASRTGGRASPTHRRAAGADGADVGGHEAHRHLLGRHEAPSGPGQRTRPPAGGPHPGRAHRGPGPPEPHGPLGGARAHQRGRHHHAADHALHGGGGSSVRAARHHRQRPDRGRRKAGGVETRHRGGHRGAAVWRRRRRRQGRRDVRRLLEGMVAGEAVTAHPAGVSLAVAERERGHPGATAPAGGQRPAHLAACR